MAKVEVTTGKTKNTDPDLNREAVMAKLRVEPLEKAPATSAASPAASPAASAEPVASKPKAVEKEVHLCPSCGNCAQREIEIVGSTGGYMELWRCMVWGDGLEIGQGARKVRRCSKYIKAKS